MQSRRTWAALVAIVAVLGIVCATALPADAAKPTSGTVTGVVKAVGKDGVTVKPEKGEAQRYVVRRVEGQPDKETTAALAKMKVGDKVEVKWTAGERNRKLIMLITKVGEVATPTASQPASQPAAKSGSASGTVTEKGEIWVRVKTADGKNERYTVRFIEGKPDAKVTKAIAELKAGDKVELKWVFNERMRVVEIHKVAATAARAAERSGERRK